jgi:hypothetical protein
LISPTIARRIVRRLFDCWSYPNADVQLLGEVKNTRIFSLPEAAAIGGS